MHELWLGDCRENLGWLDADVLVTDPPYGIDWTPNNMTPGRESRPIQGDRDLTARDDALELWRRHKGPDAPAAVFGDLRMPPPRGTRHVLVWHKTADTGMFGAVGGFRRDVEGIYLLGRWPNRWGGRSSVIFAGQDDSRAFAGHPHRKPLGLLSVLLAHCSPGSVADPFCGSGSTLVAAIGIGRRAVGCEIDPAYFGLASSRLRQPMLPGLLGDDHGAPTARDAWSTPEIFEIDP